MTGVYGFEPENISKKCSIRVGVLTVDNHMSTKNHFCPYHAGSDVAQRWS